MVSSPCFWKETRWAGFQKARVNFTQRVNPVVVCLRMKFSVMCRMRMMTVRFCDNFAGALVREKFRKIRLVLVFLPAKVFSRLV